MSREEFNAYKRTLFQEHVYELIFHESDPNVSPIPTELPFSGFLQNLKTLIPEFAAQVWTGFSCAPIKLQK